jgi:Ca-activated chloride channel homolog
MSGLPARFAATFSTKYFGVLALCAFVSFARGQAPVAPSTSTPEPPTATHSAPTPTTQPPVQGPGTESNPFTIRTTVNEVNLIFTVSDRHGHFVRDLSQSDFALLDDQKAPAQVFSFSRESNLPLRVGLLIDASTSIRQRFEFEQQAAVEFLLQVLRPKSDKAFVMGFDATPELKQDWTNSEDLLQAGINKLSPGGGTALFDALYTACHDKLLDTTRGLEPVRKAIILVSDGQDNQSRAYRDDAIKMCQRAETIVYAISTNTSPSRDKGDDVLTRISLDTGGVAFFPERIEDISNGFRNIQDELRSQYALAYKPADFKSDGAFRTIYLFCLDRRYAVRTKKGYFAPRQ